MYSHYAALDLVIPSSTEAGEHLQCMSLGKLKNSVLRSRALNFDSVNVRTTKESAF